MLPAVRSQAKQARDMREPAPMTCVTPRGRLEVGLPVLQNNDTGEGPAVKGIAAPRCESMPRLASGDRWRCFLRGLSSP